MKKLQSHKKKNLKYPALVAGLIGSLALSSCNDDAPRLMGDIARKPKPEQRDQRLDGDIKIPIKTEKEQSRVKGKIKVELKPQRLMGLMVLPDKVEKMKISPKIEE